jgi:K+-transporting ATPase A subunit
MAQPGSDVEDPVVHVAQVVGGLIYFPMLILGPIGERIVG